MIQALLLTLAPAPVLALPAPTLQADDQTALPALLGAGKEGWRPETITLPPAFAPELAIEGSEELAFAPGMFRPGAEDYFSYAFGMRLETSDAVDAEFLEWFLDGYFQGLCAAVGGERLGKSEEEIAAIRSRVKLGGRGYQAVVDLFDPFSAGDELRLFLEIESHRWQDRVEAPGETIDVLVLASSHERGAEVWDKLDSIGHGWRADRPAAAYLNHLFIIPDEATYQAIAKHDLLHALAVGETRTTVRKDLTYTGQYIYGRSTYFEFLKPDENSNLGTGHTGIAFGFEGPGDTARMLERLSKEGLEGSSGKRTRELEGDQVPWFTMLGVPSGPRPGLQLFALEYEPGFLAGWHGDLSPNVTSDRARLDRSSVLARYASSLKAGNQRGEQMLDDIVEIHLEADQESHGRILAACRAFGYSIETSGSQTNAIGPGFRIRIENAEKAGARVTGFVCALGESVSKRRESLGRLDVEMDGRRATFRYRHGE